MGFSGQITEPAAVERLIRQFDSGDPQALEELVRALYPELKRIARYQLAAERRDHTLNTTVIVHEAYMRLFAGRPRWNGRKHFMRAAAKVMRHLLVDHARERNAAKRGSGEAALTLSEDLHPGQDPGLAVLNLDAALKDIAALDPQLEQVIECRHFAGMSVQETAAALERPLRSVERDLQRARAWISDALENGRGWTG